MDKFNLITETITYESWLDGQEIDHEGQPIQINTPFAICVANCDGT